MGLDAFSSYFCLSMPLRGQRKSAGSDRSSGVAIISAMEFIGRGEKKVHVISGYVLQPALIGIVVVHPSDTRIAIDKIMHTDKMEPFVCEQLSPKLKVVTVTSSDGIAWIF